MDIQKQTAIAFHDCKDRGIKSITKCFHPDCNENSINSHILQKNGILSSIAKDNHLIEMHINKHKEGEEHFFKRIGINKAFSFNCFCNKHDSTLFKPIESGEIDFSNYKNCLLFTLRTIYNEKFRKLVNIKMQECLIEKYPDLYDKQHLSKALAQENLGLSDIKRTENAIWQDLNTGSESFVFNTRTLPRKEICLSAFYNYETNIELNNYIIANGKDKESVIDIFVNLFPYKDQSIFMMGYKKEDMAKVKGYVNVFFSDNHKRLERKITNLLMFLCETWVVSERFYDTHIKGHDRFFGDAAKFSHHNMNERRFFDINLFSDDFGKKFSVFKKNVWKNLAT